VISPRIFKEMPGLILAEKKFTREICKTGVVFTPLPDFDLAGKKS